MNLEIFLNFERLTVKKWRCSPLYFPILAIFTFFIFSYGELKTAEAEEETPPVRIAARDTVTEEILSAKTKFEEKPAASWAPTAEDMPGWINTEFPENILVEEAPNEENAENSNFEETLFAESGADADVLLASLPTDIPENYTPPKAIYPEKITVLANYASGNVAFWLIFPDKTRQAKNLRVGETTAVPYVPGAEIVFQQGEKVSRKLLQEDQIQVFADTNKELDLYVLGPDYTYKKNTRNGAPPAPLKIEEDYLKAVHSELSMRKIPGVTESTELIPGVSSAPRAPKILVIPVRILCDDKVPQALDVWEKRARARIKAASDILERTCFVRLHIIDVSTWTSFSAAKDIRELLRDFEQKVRVAPATLAIGFTGHKNWSIGKTELGVAGHPFFPYILIREAAPGTTEVERLETLLHEMGHYLGAAHSTDENSIMRTVMKDRRGRLSDFVITYDPLNTLAMNLWIRQYYRAKGPFTPQKIETDIQQKLIATYKLFQTAAEYQAANTKTPVEKNPNVEFLLAILRLKDMKPDTSESVKKLASEHQEKTEIIEKIAETAYDPEDPLGIMEEAQESESLEQAQAENHDPLKILLGENAGTLDSGDETRVGMSEGSASEMNEEDPLGISGIIRGHTSEIHENSSKKEFQKESEEKEPSKISSSRPSSVSPKNKEEKSARTENTALISLQEGEWEYETVENFQLPLRTAQYILAFTLNAITTKKELMTTPSGEFPEDKFTESVIRYAASAAKNVGGDKAADSEEGKTARIAFLLSVGILLDPSELLQNLPAYGKRFRSLETSEIKNARKKHLRNVSALGRADLCQHFSISAALAAHLSPGMVEEIGLEKEFHDDRPGGSGFDITDLNADLAGVAFSVAVQNGSISLEKIANEFRFEDFIPMKIDMPQEFKKPQNNRQADKTLEYLRTAIQALPVYQEKEG
ncbi:MAG: matrixin family metalloprotease [Planctomycetia bacterium]|nr:matrixin family metalloprotease [Planctomycetia bacterium]